MLLRYKPEYKKIIDVQSKSLNESREWFLQYVDECYDAVYLSECHTDKVYACRQNEDYYLVFHVEPWKRGLRNKHTTFEYRLYFIPRVVADEMDISIIQRSRTFEVSKKNWHNLTSKEKIKIVTQQNYII